MFFKDIIKLTDMELAENPSIVMDILLKVVPREDRYTVAFRATRGTISNLINVMFYLLTFGTLDYYVTMDS